MNLKVRSLILTTLVNFVLCIAHWYTKIIDFLILHGVNNCLIVMTPPEVNGQSTKSEATSNYMLMKYSCQTNLNLFKLQQLNTSLWVIRRIESKLDDTRKQPTKSRM